jgi:hypothetical protein
MTTPSSTSSSSLPSPHCLYVGYNPKPKLPKEKAVNKLTVSISDIVQTHFRGNDRILITVSPQTKSCCEHVSSKDKTPPGVVVYLDDQPRSLLICSPQIQPGSSQVVSKEKPPTGVIVYLGDQRSLLTYSPQTQPGSNHVVSKDKPSTGVTVYLGKHRFYRSQTKTLSNHTVSTSNAVPSGQNAG